MYNNYKNYQKSTLNFSLTWKKKSFIELKKLKDARISYVNLNLIFAFLPGLLDKVTSALCSE